MIRLIGTNSALWHKEHWIRAAHTDALEDLASSDLIDPWMPIGSQVISSTAPWLDAKRIVASYPFGLSRKASREGHAV